MEDGIVVSGDCKVCGPVLVTRRARAAYSIYMMCVALEFPVTKRQGGKPEVTGLPSTVAVHATFSHLEWKRLLVFI